ncbi:MULTISPECIES: GH1 family beta-glucosidase [Pseudoalteromonas]|uniref:Beta-glucosidase n=1 Tax=Pseudoalteromonas amylolytica TaxID=1859457 RepID=A0A1S1MX89_9GAMM|nr:MULTISPECIES: GH1 family beta-glucosidase [Pseudoalteromonas]OHU88079.1 beta-glucosidase [Pseudoalteromonas sp. JW3]OHU91519.1 beta-glucosidase [Pseudoalteromonas amylolytica]
MTSLRLKSDSPLNNEQFTFGVATSSYQIEGDRAARLETIWDKFCEGKGNIADGSNGDVACEHIKHWQQDVQMIAGLGVDAYRFSVAWGRILNRDGSINERGLKFYVSLLDKLKELGIKAYVTLYHWDLPQYLEDTGGWLNRDTAFAFANYVDVVSREFGNRVYSYATLNEPWCSAYLGYEAGIHAPGLKSKQFGKQAAHHLLLAHGLAMKVLAKNSPSSKNGIVLNFSPCYAASSSEQDVAAARLADEHFNQWYIRPLLEGRYPDAINDMSDINKPIIESRDMSVICQPIDYIGVNYYSRAIYQHCDEDGFKVKAPETMCLTDMGWEIYPEGLYKLLTDLNRRYQLPEVIITENGAAMKDELVAGVIDDQDRIAYLQTHLAAIEKAIGAGVDVSGYFAWSLMDNFEWAEGYKKRFGIVYVDYKSQKRTLKQSAKAYRGMLLGRLHK